MFNLDPNVHVASLLEILQKESLYELIMPGLFLQFRFPSKKKSEIPGSFPSWQSVPKL